VEETALDLKANKVNNRKANRKKIHFQQILGINNLVRGHWIMTGHSSLAGRKA
jgi:hypothetical protein